MNDPHVTLLHYAIKSDDRIKYHDPPQFCVKNDLGIFTISGSNLTVQPWDHFDRAADARAHIEPFLLAWSMREDLKLGLDALTFEFSDADVVDRAPYVPGGARTLRVEAASLAVVGDNVTVRRTLREYALPPTAHEPAAEYEIGHARWRRYAQGREPLQSMAYFVLTLAEASHGGRKKAAAALGVELDILSKLGVLTSENKGDARTARKVKRSLRFADLSPDEAAWLECATRLLILRLGGADLDGGPKAVLTMADLPHLKGDPPGN